MLVLAPEGVLAVGVVIAVVVVALTELVPDLKRAPDGVLALGVAGVLFTVAVLVTRAQAPGGGWLIVAWLIWGLVGAGVTALVRHGLASRG